MERPYPMKVGSTELILKLGDITKETVDVIVNAANPLLSGGIGVDGAIHKAGGPSILAECKQIMTHVKKLEHGDAQITAAGRLKASHIVHAVGPIWSGGKKHEARELEDAYYNSLLLAKEYGGKSVALPSISTGAYGYPVEAAAKIALTTCKDFCLEHPCFERLVFVLYTQDIYDTYQKTLPEVVSGS
jgi:O-acetyl-ADP-ribose deacetylase